MAAVPKWLARLPLEPKRALQWLELDTIELTLELVPITGLLREACALVESDAAERSLALVIVPADGDVFVRRCHVVFVVAAMLRTAIGAVPEHGRIAVTAEEIDRELVFAVYDSGKLATPSSRYCCIATKAAYTLGGHVWSTRGPDGNLALFSLPLYRGNN